MSDDAEKKLSELFDPSFWIQSQDVSQPAFARLAKGGDTASKEAIGAWLKAVKGDDAMPEGHDGDAFTLDQFYAIVVASCGEKQASEVRAALEATKELPEDDSVDLAPEIEKLLQHGGKTKKKEADEPPPAFEPPAAAEEPPPPAFDPSAGGGNSAELDEAKAKIAALEKQNAQLERDLSDAKAAASKPAGDCDKCKRLADELADAKRKHEGEIRDLKSQKSAPSSSGDTVSKTEYDRLKSELEALKRSSASSSSASPVPRLDLSPKAGTGLAAHPNTSPRSPPSSTRSSGLSPRRGSISDIQSNRLVDPIGSSSPRTDSLLRRSREFYRVQCEKAKERNAKYHQLEASRRAQLKERPKYTAGM